MICLSIQLNDVQIIMFKSGVSAFVKFIIPRGLNSTVEINNSTKAGSAEEDYPIIWIVRQKKSFNKRGT